MKKYENDYAYLARHLFHTMQNSIILWEQDVAGITSRRICRYVVTRRLLRRDASDVTS